MFPLAFFFSVIFHCQKHVKLMQYTSHTGHKISFVEILDLNLIARTIDVAISLRGISYSTFPYSLVKAHMHRDIHY